MNTWTIDPVFIHANSLYIFLFRGDFELVVYLYFPTTLRLEEFHMFDWTETPTGFVCTVKNCFKFMVEPEGNKWRSRFEAGDVVIKNRDGFADSEDAKNAAVEFYIKFIEECLTDIAVCEVRKKHVLFIEDDSRITRSVSSYLVREGYDVINASDGKDGLEKLRHHEIDIVVTDLNMPNMSGEDFLFILKKKYHSTIPVIVQTGFGTADNTAKLLNLGVCKILLKPYPFEDLKDAIQESLAEF
jgi:CheY-like chemotaxis protein